MRKERKSAASPRALSQSPDPLVKYPAHPPKPHKAFLIGSLIALGVWLIFLIWLAIHS